MVQCLYINFNLQVQEFEHINGYYSMPELIRKPCELIKTAVPGAASNAATSSTTGNGSGELETPKSAATSTSATPATSAAPSPAPTSNTEVISKLLFNY